jgi:katanin p60 ATPase-containing subunit A1
VTKIEQETNISLEKWDTADNIDLFMIFLDYEQYYEARFGKVPKVVKKMDDRSISHLTQQPTISSRRWLSGKSSSTHPSILQALQRYQSKPLLSLLPPNVGSSPCSQLQKEGVRREGQEREVN